MSDQLKPCPFCGNTGPCKAATIGFPVAVSCESCNAQGPAKFTAREANEAWNRRALQWQPIETAPKDGTIIRLWDSRREIGIEGYWHRDEGMNNANGYEPAWEAWLAVGDLVLWDDEQGELTHWQPLPEAPKDGL